MSTVSEIGLLVENCVYLLYLTSQRKVPLTDFVTVFDVRKLEWWELLPVFGDTEHYDPCCRVTDIITDLP